MIIKKLVRSGNSQAIILDQKYLKEAGLSDDTQFEIIVLPKSIIMRSIQQDTK